MKKCFPLYLLFLVPFLFSQQQQDSLLIKKEINNLNDSLSFSNSSAPIKGELEVSYPNYKDNTQIEYDSIYETGGITVKRFRIKQLDTSSTPNIGNILNNDNQDNEIDYKNTLGKIDPYKVLGEVKGNLTVSLTGAAIYNVDFELPKGVGDLIPDLGLTYNSQRGYGAAGYGWDFSGISYIERVPKTIYHDGKSQSVSYTQNDAFALDGVRLKRTSNQNVFVLENSSSIKVVKDPLYNDPMNFTVYQSDGTKLLYGDYGCSTTTKYYLSKVITAEGNEIRYSYEKNGNDLLIKKIIYGRSKDNTKYNKIDFTYSGTAKNRQYYHRGTAYNTKKRLSRVSIEGEIAHDYKFYYMNSSLGESRLSSIEKIDNGGDKFNRLRFHYGKVNTRITKAKQIKVFPGALFNWYNNGNYEFDDLVFGDFVYGSTSSFIMKKRKGGRKFSVYSDFDTSLNFAYEVSTRYHDILPSKIKAHNGSLYSYADAITTIRRNQEDIIIRTFLMAAHGPVYQFTIDTYIDMGKGDKKIKYYTLDLDRDGIQELVILGKDRRLWSIKLDRNHTDEDIKYLGRIDEDFDEDKHDLFFGNVLGNNMLDIILFKSDHVKVYRQKENFKYEYSGKTDGFKYNKLSGEMILPGDFNGDGLIDFMMPTDTHTNMWNFFFSNGSNQLSFYKKRTAINFRINTIIKRDHHEYRYLPVDVNNDGKTDIITYYGHSVINQQNVRTSNFYVYENLLNDNRGVPKFILTNSLKNKSPNIMKFGNMFLLDAISKNKDPELVMFSGNKMNIYNLKYDRSNETRLSKIINSKGKVSKIKYSDLGHYKNTGQHEDEIYSNSSGLLFPYVELKKAPGFNVVNTITEEAHNVSRKQKFRYHGAVAHTQGLGFLGFKGIARSNFYSKPSEILWNISMHDPTLRGATTKEYTSHYSGFNHTTDAVHIKKHTYKTSESFQGAKVFVVSPTSIVSEDKLSGVKIEETFAYNNFFNIVNHKTKKGEWTKETQYNYAYNFGAIDHNFYMARMTEEKSNTTYKGASIRTMNLFSYSNGKLSQMKKYNNHLMSGPYLSETYTYGIYGNLTSKTLKSKCGLATFNCKNISLAEKWFYSSDGRKVIKHIDEKGKITKNEFDQSGNKTKEIIVFDSANENGGYNKHTNYFYDELGRVIKITDSDNHVTNFSYKWVDSFGNHKTTKTSNHSPDEVSYYDPLNRKYRTEIKSLNNKTVVTDIKYNNLDQIEKISEPYFKNQNPTLWTQNFYDKYGRNVKTITPTGKTINTSYKPFTTTVKDGTHTKTSTINSSGFVVAMKDDGGNISYTHHPNGLEKTATYQNQTIRTKIDFWGRKSELIDPSAGTYKYHYDIFGNIVTEILPSGVKIYEYNDLLDITKIEVKGENTNTITSYLYNDPQGRVTSKTVKDLINNVTYTVQHSYQGFNLVESNESNTRFPVNVKNNYGYDILNRNNYVKTTVNTPYINASDIVHYHKEFDNNGFVKSIKNNNKILWEANTANERGLITQATFGNQTQKYNYYDKFGLPKKEEVYTSSHLKPIPFITNTYTFDTKNTLLKQRSINGNIENFEYDSLDRLVKTNGTITHSYDDSGRILNNSSVGKYNYLDTKDRYKVASIKLNPKGNNHYTNNRVQDVSYNVYKAPVRIKEAQRGIIDFEYTEGRRSYMFYGGLQENKMARRYIKYYSGIAPVEIVNDNTEGSIKIITYINGNPYNAEIVKVKKQKHNGLHLPIINEFFYIHKDYLGNYIAITNESGYVVENARYGAWGKVNYFFSNYSGNNFNENSLLGRGFTGHEHLFGVGLIHMNGRLYDPLLHRFLMPDNYIQDPTNTQNFNRYAYAYNNPLMYTDESGEFLSFLFGAAIGVLVNGVGNLMTHQHFFKGAGKAALLGGIGGYFANAIGAAANGMNGLGKISFQIVAHGHVNGVLSGLSGGTYGQGFLSSGVGSLAATLTGGVLISNNRSWRTISMIANGGLASGITSRVMGGRFWDGFRMGVITAGLNHVAHALVKQIQTRKWNKYIESELDKNGYEPYGSSTLSKDYAEKMIRNIPILSGVKKRGLNKGEIAGFANLTDALGSSYGITNVETGEIFLSNTSNFVSTNFGMAITIYHEMLHIVYRWNPSNAPSLMYFGQKRKDYEHFLIHREIYFLLESRMKYGVNYNDLRNISNKYGWKF